MSNTTITQSIETVGQINLSYKSVEDLKLDTRRITNFFKHGRQVWIGRAGYGVSQYAMLNVTRWNQTAGDHLCECEFNNLPASWCKAIRNIIWTRPATSQTA